VHDNRSVPVAGGLRVVTAQVLELRLVVSDSVDDQEPGYVKYTARGAAMSLCIQEGQFPSGDLIRAPA
jgi:hypothetical protein